jgi:hypothetical protein
MQDIKQMVAWMNPIFGPPSHAIARAVPDVVMNFFGAGDSIGQGLLSVVLTIGVVIAAFLTKMVQVVETRQKVAANKIEHAKIIAKNQMSKQTMQAKRKALDALVVMVRHKDEHNSAQALALCSAAKHRILHSTHDMTIYLFASVQEGLTAVNASVQAVRSHIKRLRPMDAVPDYRYVAHAIEQGFNPNDASAMCQSLERFCNQSGVLCTESVQQAITAKDLPVKLNSLGLYDLVDRQTTEELFQLDLS